jgi:hypothetical protein
MSHYIGDINGNVQHIQKEGDLMSCGKKLLNSISFGVVLNENFLPLCKICAKKENQNK